MSNMYTILVLLCSMGYVFAQSEFPECDVLARTESGWVCGAKRPSESGNEYASFRGVPYAKQPLGELRFQELQPAEPWDGAFNATVEGPVCPYHDIFYYNLFQPQGISEACIHANVHVPMNGLPHPEDEVPSTGGLPIVVFIHGGGWICGSGDADYNGPEYLVDRGVIVITFNYRLDVFGFLTLNTTKVPGNQGLRDQLTLLRWVQSNARNFGGDPTRVTLAGQSAGAASAHLLSLSPASAGLFQRLWLMSGTGIPSFYTTSPTYSQLVTTTYLSLLGINSTDYDWVHDQLVQMPLEVLNNASGTLLAQLGVTSFVPVVETPLPGVTPVISADPETLIANGNGNNITLVVGFTSDECEANVPRLTEINAVALYQASPLAGLNPHLVYTLPANVTAEIATRVGERYFGDTVTLDKFVKLCTETYFAYPAIKLARARRASGGAAVYLYKFSYEPEPSILQTAHNLTYDGAGHSEDMNQVFKVNSSPLINSGVVSEMRDRMSDLVANFAKNNVPSYASHPWRPITTQLKYNHVMEPKNHQYTRLENEDEEMVEFFDELAEI